MLPKPCYCPRCAEPVEEIEWEPTLVRSNVSEEGIIGAAPFDTVLPVPPGRYVVLPCGHTVEPEDGRLLWEVLRKKTDDR